LTLVYDLSLKTNRYKKWEKPMALAIQHSQQIPYELNKLYTREEFWHTKQWPNVGALLELSTSPSLPKKYVLVSGIEQTCNSVWGQSYNRVITIKGVDLFNQKIMGLDDVREKGEIIETHTVWDDPIEPPFPLARISVVSSNYFKYLQEQKLS
jgi:hypothetical protein